MCGIAGIIARQISAGTNELISGAVGSLQHRGPDCTNQWSDTHAALGHCRLSIIDLTRSAQQPMHYHDRYTIVHNGEIYNYIELRSELEKKGFNFYTATDTEIILAAYEAYGTDCLQYFEGMFAFALWDRNEKTLFAASDRFGEKPFFYATHNNQFVFASEMKALWKMNVPKEVNTSLLYNFLSFGYVQNPQNSSETFYHGIDKLPAASYLLYNAADETITINRYWDIDLSNRSNISETEAIEQFDALFSASIKKRLRSDVSIGTSLSGGLDSSTVVAYCQQEKTDRYTHKSFTAVFEGFEKDERKYAELVAKRFKLDQQFVTVEDASVVSMMNEVMQFQEEPISSASPLAQYKIFREAKASGVSVLLDGQGADEILAGYDKYYPWYWAELYRNRSLKKSGEMQAAHQMGIAKNFGLTRKLAALFPHFAASIMQVRKEKRAANSNILAADFRNQHKTHAYYTLPTEFDLNHVLYYNTVTNGLGELLRYADRNSMASAVEVRLPFLDHHLVEFIFSLPASMKIHNGWTKWLLRKTTETKLPADIVWRKNKVGFEPPQARWMQQKDVQDAIRAGKELLAGKGVITKSEASKKIQPHNAYAAEGKDWKLWSASYLFK